MDSKHSKVIAIVAGIVVLAVVALTAVAVTSNSSLDNSSDASGFRMNPIFEKLFGSYDGGRTAPVEPPQPPEMDNTNPVGNLTEDQKAAIESLDEVDNEIDALYKDLDKSLEELENLDL